MKVLRLIVLVAVAAAIGLALTRLHGIDSQSIQRAIAAEPLAPLYFIGLQIAASLLFVPRTVLGIAAGLVFGLVWGTVWALAGAVAGAAAGFALVRWFGATGLLDMSPGIGRMVERAEHGGWRAVAILRLTPVPHSAANTVLAMTNIGWRQYLFGSFIGMLPMTLVQVDIGASGNAALKNGQWVLACLMLALGLAGSFLLKRAGQKRAAEDSKPPPATLD
jgi:uncharacterized membrane protein YdjX (TVP38/TMEM64 family)